MEEFYVLQYGWVLCIHHTTWGCWSLISNVFERRTSTGSRLFALLSCDFEQTFGQIVSIIIQTLSNKNLCSRQSIFKEKKAHFLLTFVAQKCWCLSSLLLVRGGGGGHFARAGCAKTSARLSGTGRNLIRIILCEPLTRLVRGTSTFLIRKNTETSENWCQITVEFF